MTTTIQAWTATCSVCSRPISGRDVLKPGKERDRQHEHDNPDDMYLDIPGTGGAHSSWPDEGTIRVAKTTEH